MDKTKRELPGPTAREWGHENRQAPARTGFRDAIQPDKSLVRTVLTSWLPDHRRHLGQAEAAVLPSTALIFFQPFAISKGKG